MAMQAKEIKEWLNGIDDERMIAIDDGGLSLVVKGEFSYCEVGGIPLAATDDNGDTGHEPGWEEHT